MKYKKERDQILQAALSEVRDLPLTSKGWVDTLTRTLMEPPGPSMLTMLASLTGNPLLAEQIVSWMQHSLLAYGQIKVRVDTFPSEGRVEVFDCIHETIAFVIRIP